MASGFLLGMQHSLDPDHVAAVSTIVSQRPRLGRSALAGAVWGLGHTAMLLLVGIAVLMFKIAIPANIAQVFDCLVGVLLLYLGGALLKKVVVDKVHLHSHSHGDIEHVHLHSHKTGLDHHHLHRPFLIGAAHGLAGSAGIMLLVMASMPSMAEGLFFTLVFGLGSILGMTMSGTIVSLPFRVTSRWRRVNAAFMILAAIVTITIGLHVIRNNWVFSSWTN